MAAMGAPRCCSRVWRWDDALRGGVSSETHPAPRTGMDLERRFQMMSAQGDTHAALRIALGLKWLSEAAAHGDLIVQHKVDTLLPR